MNKLRNLFNVLKGLFAFSKTNLSTKEKWYLALPGPAISIGGVLIHNVFIKYYTDVIGLDAKYVGWVYIIYNIWNAINDPILGTYIDRRRYSEKHGKYVYILKVTVPFMVISSFAMMLSSPSWSNWVIFLIYTFELFIYDTAATAYGIAYASYKLIAAPTIEERVDINTIQTYVANVLSFFVTMIPTLLLVGDGKREAIIPVFTVVILGQCLFYWYSLRALKDKPEMYTTLNEQHISTSQLLKDFWKVIKSRQFITYVSYSVITLGPMSFYFTPYLYYMDHVIKASGIAATIVDTSTHILALLFLPVMANIVKKYGTKRSIYWGTIPAILGYTGIFFAKSVLAVAVCYVIIVFTVNYFGMSCSPMGALIIDEDERVSGVRKTGLFNGIFALFITAFSGLQTVIFTNVISLFGYDGLAKVQSSSAVLGIRIATGLVPLCLTLVGLIPMFFYPFNKKREDEISAFSKNARRGKVLNEI